MFEFLDGYKDLEPLLAAGQINQQIARVLGQVLGTLPLNRIHCSLFSHQMLVALFFCTAMLCIAFHFLVARTLYMVFYGFLFCCAGKIHRQTHAQVLSPDEFLLLKSKIKYATLLNLVKRWIIIVLDQSALVLSMLRSLFLVKHFGNIICHVDDGLLLTSPYFVLLRSCKEIMDMTDSFFFESGYHDESSLGELKPEHKQVTSLWCTIPIAARDACIKWSAVGW